MKRHPSLHLVLAAAGFMALAASAQETPRPAASAASAPLPYSARVAADKLASEDARKAAHGDAEALARLSKRADEADPSARYFLALLYKDGKGVPKDPARYVALLLQAGEQDHAGAQTRLIALYEEGAGVPKDPVLAAQWARRAAEQGELAGQMALVVDYYYGRGVPRNLVEAIKWHSVLEASGFVTRDEAFAQELETDAGPIQAAEGKALAKEWLTAFRARIRG